MAMNNIITDKEYDKLIRRLEFYASVRNNLLTFSFTAVLAILGIALAMDTNSTSVWLCLTPFFLIIPFSARIAYYRLAAAHINSFLKQCSVKEMQFEIGANIVTEKGCRFYSLIAWLVNHEMVLLGLGTSFIFYLKCEFSIKDWSNCNYLKIIVPILLTVMVYLISDSTYRYKKLMEHFEREWNTYLENK